jgi:hypothetical protein
MTALEGMSTWRLPWSSGRYAPPSWTCCVAHAWSWRTPNRRWTRRPARRSKGPNPPPRPPSVAGARHAWLTSRNSWPDASDLGTTQSWVGQPLQHAPEGTPRTRRVLVPTARRPGSQPRLRGTRGSRHQAGAPSTATQGDQATAAVGLRRRDKRTHSTVRLGRSPPGRARCGGTGRPRSSSPGRARIPPAAGLLPLAQERGSWVPAEAMERMQCCAILGLQPPYRLHG